MSEKWVHRDLPLVGDTVLKTGGDYTFRGVVVTSFPKRGGQPRVVVENDDGVLHIFNPDQLVVLKK